MNAKGDTRRSSVRKEGTSDPSVTSKTFTFEVVDVGEGRRCWGGGTLADCSGELALPVFSGEGEAKMFVWLGGAFEDAWRVRETSAGELVSILYGPCAGVGMVALDPSPGMTAETIRLVSLSRERFVSWVVDSPCCYSPGARHNARDLVTLL